MTPALQDKLAFTVTVTGSYESAAQLVGKWGCPVDNSKLPALVAAVPDPGTSPTKNSSLTL